MKNSIVKQYMAQNDLNQNQITSAAGLVRNSLHRQVDSDFDGITMRTVKLLANVLSKEPSEVFADLYKLSGGINDYCEDSGIYTELHYTVDGTSLTPDAHPGDDTFTTRNALREVQAVADNGVGENERVDVSGGIGDGEHMDDNITISVLPDGIKYEFEDGASDSFKAMWHELMGANLPHAQEW